MLNSLSQQLGVLISLIYKQLAENLPEEPIPFVANYVHYLNTHREEIILEPDVDVPFDRVQATEEELNNEQVAQFARELVLKCALIASMGISYVNTTQIIESILHKVIPSECSILEAENNLESATITVHEILMSVIQLVTNIKKERANLYSEQILEAILEKVCPSVKRDSETFLQIRESVYSFVQDIMKSLVNKIYNQQESQHNLQILD